MQPKGYIYLLRSEDGYCKIGLATKLDRRIRQLKIQLPFSVEVIHAVPVLSNLYQAERYLHERFAEHRMNGEWFRLPWVNVDWFRYLVIGDLDVLMNYPHVNPEWAPWELLCELEPRLPMVEREARAIGFENIHNYTRPFYKQIKPKIIELVGRWAKARSLLLRSSRAYDVAYFRLLDLTCPHTGEDEPEDYFEYDR